MGDNEFDNRILLSLVNQFFRAESYNEGFKLYESSIGSSEESLSVPEEKTHKGFMQWIKSIDIAETPAWSGLPNNVEKLLRERQSAALIAEIKKIQGIGDDLDGDEDDENEKDN